MLEIKLNIESEGLSSGRKPVAKPGEHVTKKEWK